MKFVNPSAYALRHDDVNDSGDLEFHELLTFILYLLSYWIWKGAILRS